MTKKELKDLKLFLQAGELYIFPPSMERATATDRTGRSYIGMNVTKDLLDLLELEVKKP